jgi:hypothetical protein
MHSWKINPDSPAGILTGNSNAVNGSRSRQPERLSLLSWQQETEPETRPHTVGVTSALLAANAAGRWDCGFSLISSRHSSTATCDSLLKVRVDEPKAAELNRLIERGDWEGVLIRAASTFESDGKVLDGSVFSHQKSTIYIWRRVVPSF